MGYVCFAGYVDGDITESLMIQPTKPVRNELDNRSANLPKQENSLPKTSGTYKLLKIKIHRVNISFAMKNHLAKIVPSIPKKILIIA